LPEADIGNPRLDRRASLNAAGGPMNVTADGDVLFSRAAPHGIHRFSALGEERATVAADEELLEPGVETFLEVLDWERFRVRNDYWYPRSVFVAELEDGRILNVVWFQRQGESLWQLYSASGRRIAASRIDRAYFPYTVADDGDLLAHYLHPATEEPVVVRLRVEY